MKQNTHRSILAMYLGGLTVVVALIVFLMIETQFFVQQARELVRLKEDYVNYTLALKRMIAECKTDQNEQQFDVKKKKISDDEFLVVNRDVDYLMQSAIKYARARNMEQVVRQLYQVPDWKFAEKKQTIKKRPLRKRTQGYALAVDSDIAALRTEHHFIYPLQKGTFHFTSRFGPRKRANGSWGFHYGLDMAAPRGTPIKAVAHGVVVEARFNKGFGNTVLISHSNKVKTRYAHLSKLDVRAGDLVEQGQCIGRVGNTGYTRGKNGIHLHFEVLIYGKQINPLYFL